MRIRTLNRFTFESYLKYVAIAIGVVWLLWFALVNTMEYYDGVEYLVSSFAYLGFPWRINPKNAFMIYLGSTLAFPLVVLKIRPSLEYFHLAFLALNLCILPICIFVARQTWSAIDRATVALVALASPLYLHYASFVLPGLICGLTVGIWLALERAKLSFSVKLTAVSLVLAVILLNRPYAILIPGIYYLLVVISEPKKILSLIATALASAFFFLLAFSTQHASRLSTDLWSGLKGGLDLMRWYANDVNAAPVVPAYAYGNFLFKGLGVAGFLLLLFGLYLVTRNRRAEPFLFRLSVGVLGFFCLLLFVSHKEARYILPGLPILILIQVYSFSFLKEKFRYFGLIATLLLIGFSLPTLLHFRDPIYRSDLHREISLRIAQWSKSDSATFIFGAATFHPKNPVFDRHDLYFYIYHYANHVLAFHSGLRVGRVSLPFKQYGYPIPDDIEKRFPENHTLVAPTPKIVNTWNAGDSLDPIEALRWRHNSPELGRENCLEVPKHICIERITVFPGLTWN